LSVPRLWVGWTLGSAVLESVFARTLSLAGVGEMVSLSGLEGEFADTLLFATGRFGAARFRSAPRDCAPRAAASYGARGCSGVSDGSPPGAIILVSVAGSRACMGAAGGVGAGSNACADRESRAGEKSMLRTIAKEPAAKSDTPIHSFALAPDMNARGSLAENGSSSPSSASFVEAPAARRRASSASTRAQSAALAS
jgi:hypothetical protein